MMNPRVDGIAGALPQSADDLKLRQTAQQMQGMFVEQLFKAMRETVPEGGLVDGGAGEEIFSSMLDGHLASEVGTGWDRGIGAALYRQLRNVLPPAAGEAPAPDVPPLEG